MTIEELIQKLEALRDEHGPHIEVRKRQPYPMRSAELKSVKLDDSDDDPCNWTIEI